MPLVAEKVSSRRLYLAGACMAVVSGCSILIPHYTLRYLLRVRLGFEGREYEGSGIIKIVWTDNRGGFANVGPSFLSRQSGEAVVIDFDGRRTPVFALLSRPGYDDDYCARMPLAVLGARVPEEKLERGKAGDAFVLVSQVDGAVPLPEDERPFLVSFGDLQDPKSVVQLTPWQRPIPASMNVTYLGATIEVTHGWVTRKIRSVLPWLSGLKTSLGGDLLRRPFGAPTQKFGRADFIREEA